MKIWISDFLLLPIKIVYIILVFINGGFQTFGVILPFLERSMEFIDLIGDNIYYWAHPKKVPNEQKR